MRVIFAGRLTAQVVARSVHLRAQSAHVQQPVDTVRFAGAHEALDQCNVRSLESTTVVTALVEDPDQVDDRVAAG